MIPFKSKTPVSSNFKTSFNFDPTLKTSLDMTNNYYATYSTSSSQFLDPNTPQLITTDHFNKNPLRASEIVATSKQSSNVVKLPLEELQMRFVLFAAEIDRLLILNSLTNKEAEHWRKKYLNSENLSPPKVKIYDIK